VAGVPFHDLRENRRIRLVRRGIGGKNKIGFVLQNSSCAAFEKQLAINGNNTVAAPISRQRPTEPVADFEAASQAAREHSEHSGWFPHSH